MDTKNPQQNTSKQNPITYEKNCTLWSSEIFPIILGYINIWKSINVIHNINRTFEHHTIISIDTEKALDKISFSFMVKITPQSRDKKKLLQPDKGHLDTIQSYFICNVERLDSHPR